MDYYSCMSDLYRILQRVVDNTVRVTTFEIEEPKTVSRSRRLQEAPIIITENKLLNVDSVCTAHLLEDYYPKQLNFETLMLEADTLIIDEILKGEVCSIEV